MAVSMTPPLAKAPSQIRALAFYLPQYHPIAENDEWWGPGFTEWRNVTKAKPLFRGHYQPHLPADLGFYDLRLPEAREAQASMARSHGLHGFCYYHYWFNGRRVLETPFEAVLASGQPDFPFCLCWANENWTRVWDGGEKEILLQQDYDFDDDLRHIESLIPAFRDKRYIRIDGKPIFLVYRTGIMPDPERTARLWRTAAQNAGLPGIYLIRVESHGDTKDPRSLAFDASVEFAPFNGLRWEVVPRGPLRTLLSRLGLLPAGITRHAVYDYGQMATEMENREHPGFKRFRCATPSWDNTARRQINGTILVDSTPERYETWLRRIATRTREDFTGDERLCFINAWNEWAEGNHLEPDLKFGAAYLQATDRALAAPLANGSVQSVELPIEGKLAPDHRGSVNYLMKRRYWALLEKLKNSSVARSLKYLRTPWGRTEQ